MIAFLTAAVALVGFGLYLLIDSLTTLVLVEPPTIQSVMIFGRRVWLGWIMIAALIYTFDSGTNEAAARARSAPEGVAD